MTVLEAPAGNPDHLASAIHDYERTERALAQAADDILASLAEGDGDSIVALGEKGTRAASGLNAARERYATAANALREYEVALRHHHRVAHSAIDDHAQANHVAYLAHRDLEDAIQMWRHYSQLPDMQDMVDHWERQVWQARQAVDEAERRIADAVDAYRRAQQELAAAALIAAEQIRDTFEDAGNAVWNWLKDAAAAVGDFLEDLAEWAVNFLKGVLEVVMTVVIYVLLAVAIVMVIVVAVVVFLVVLAIALVLIAGALYFLLTQVLPAVVAGLSTLILTEQLGLDGAAQIRMVLAAMTIASPLIGSFLISRIASDVLAPPLEVTTLEESPVTPADADAAATLDKAVPENVGDILEWGGMVDEIGGDAQAVVDIAQVTDADGNVTWVVTLPSTKDWGVPFDVGAPNDLDSNLALMALPEVRTQYERAVLEAMTNAGIPPGANVVVNGWSQGGIIAASLVESGAGGYHYTGLIAAGAPIDDFHIPADVAVLQVKHENDPVHRLDGTVVGETGAHRVELWDGTRSGSVGAPTQTALGIGHSNDNYVATLDQHLTATGGAGSPYNAMFEQVLPSGGEYTIEHTQYAFHE